MFSLFVFLARIVTGAAVLLFSWFVFDKIHDRNTEIIVALIGLQYSYVFLISRRLDYFGLSLFSFFGRTITYIQKAPYDQILREEVGIHAGRRHLYLNVIFAALIELLCLFRLFTSLVGYGWGALSDPINGLIQSPF
jgi:hypothetical protein